MSSFLRGRIRRLERVAHATGPALACYRSADPAHRAEVDAWAEAMAELGRTVLFIDLTVFQPVGPPTQRRSQPGDPGHVEPLLPDLRGLH